MTCPCPFCEKRGKHDAPKNHPDVEAALARVLEHIKAMPAEEWRAKIEAAKPLGVGAELVADLERSICRPKGGLDEVQKKARRN
jgi:hypothetical protein